MSLRESFLTLCSPDTVADPDIRDLALRVLERCQSANLDASTLAHPGHAQDELALRQSFAFALFIARASKSMTASVDAHRNRSAGSLSYTLQAFGVGLEDFLKELPAVIRRAEPCLTEFFDIAVPMERRLKLRELQTSFVYTTVLAKKSKDLFRSYFDLAVSARGATDIGSPFYCAWLLFVTAKAKLLPPFPDMVASFNLLICVLNVAIVHIPAAQRVVDLNDHSLFPVRSETGGADTLQSLCLVNKANLTAVKALMFGMDNMLRDVDSSVTSPIRSHTAPSQDLVISCTFHPGFMAKPAATAAIAEKLNAEYKQLCTGITDMDERSFLAKAVAAPSTPKPAAPPSLSRCVVGSPQSSASPARSRMVYLSPMGKRPSTTPMDTPSPHRRGPTGVFGLAQTPGIQGLMSNLHGTPVSDAMSAASWLHDMALRTQQPTQQLQRFFKACDHDMTDSVAARIELMAQSILPQEPASQHALQALQAAMTNERRSQGVKLYYGVLEAMLKAEEGRTQRSNFTSLLSSNSFHKCLAGCAFELVVAAYKMVTHAFPAVLEKLELHAFDLCKMIEPFMRYEPSIPEDLKRHLHSIEEKIVECLAWEQGSSFYPQLVVAYEMNTDKQTGDKPEEALALQRSSPAHSESSPKSHPTTPSKRKTPSGSSLPSTPNKSLKGEQSSSPSRLDESSKASEPQKSKTESQRTAQRNSSASGTSSSALGSNAASTFQTQEARPPAALQSPQQATTRSALSAFMSPVGNVAGVKASAGYQLAPNVDVPWSCAFLQQPGSASEDKPGRCILQEFLRKVLRLAANRAHDLCNRLDIEDAHRQETETQVYHLLHCVVRDHTHLLYNRHLDQIVLSAIYGVCKVAQLRQISFKQIINHYRRQPQAKSDIFRTVVLRQTEPQLQVQETGDVIAFYNHVFVPVVKTDLLKVNQIKADLPLPPLAEGLRGTSPVRDYMRPDFPANGFSTPPPPSRALRGLSSGNTARKVSIDKQVFVSPLRSSPKQAPTMTPRTRTLYAFVGESQQPYQSPSKDLDFINGHISGRVPHIVGVQGSQAHPRKAASAVNSGSSGRSSNDASQSPTMSNSADLLRQSSTVSGAARQESGALPLLQAAADRADKWRAANENGPRDTVAGAEAAASSQADNGHRLGALQV